ncbi:TPM domain-containing protein [Sandarakinorhabdus sp. DWP1-3-1]|uniref:TPM domain-containing protein n=1 Tax=Sandarakinorhabdus sp. DWP1-3-1 TaxID=2804627 RepID=UPI003CF8E927
MVAGHFDGTAAMPRDGAAARVLLVLALVLGLLAWPALAAPSFPKLTGRVTDAANILPAATVAALDARLAELETTTTTQLVVATVPDLQGYEIDEYGYQLGRAWGIGQKGTNNGALLIVAPNDRKVRIEVGYGLEGTLTDALTSQIIRRNIIPYFRAGDMAGGVNAGADALIKLLALPPEQQAQAAAQAAAARPARGEGGGGFPLGTIVWIVIIIIWLLVSVSRGRRGRSSGPVILWGPGLGGWGGGGGGGWGGGGGGFGGGGGSFGGGGSSGSW